MRRVLAVQDQLKRLAEWRLADAEALRRDLEAEALALDGFIDRSELSDPLATTAMNHRRRVAGREAAAKETIEQETKATTEARSLHRLAERMIGGLKTDIARERERQDLERLLEDLAGRDPASGASLP